MTSNGVFTNEPRPRLCHLRRWPDFVGYGFNLHCEKNRPGQFIGKVDDDSPAQSAGLREGDRIIEVNFVPVGNENHRQVVARIKEGVSRDGAKHDDEVILLVVDSDTDDYYKHKSVVVRSTDPNVEKLSANSRNASENNDDSSQSGNKSAGKVDSPIARETPSPPQMTPNRASRDYKNVTDFTGPTVTQTRNGNSPAISRTSDQSYGRDDDDVYLPSSPPSSEKDVRREMPPTNNNTFTDVNTSPRSPPNDYYDRPVAASPPRVSDSNGPGGVLDLKMSAAEYREKLREQHARKRDPRQDQQMSMKKKHELIDGL